MFGGTHFESEGAKDPLHPPNCAYARESPSCAYACEYAYM